MTRAGCFALVCWLAACATPSSELTDANRCGPDALAAAFAAAGRPTSPEDLKDALLTPGLGGTLPEDMVSATRRAGLVPTVIKSVPELLSASVDGATPIIILENRRVSFWPQWHYRIASPTEVRNAAFQSDWRADGAWALVVKPHR